MKEFIWRPLRVDENYINMKISF